MNKIKCPGMKMEGSRASNCCHERKRVQTNTSFSERRKHLLLYPFHYSSYRISPTIEMGFFFILDMT